MRIAWLAKQRVRVNNGDNPIIISACLPDLYRVRVSLVCLYSAWWSAGGAPPPTAAHEAFHRPLIRVNEHPVAEIDPLILVSTRDRIEEEQERIQGRTEKIQGSRGRIRKNRGEQIVCYMND
jgi:hypothetical protein